VQESDAGIFDCLLCDPVAAGWINAFFQENSYLRSMKEPRSEFANQVPSDYFDFGSLGGGGGYGGGFGLGGVGEFLLLTAAGIAIADSANSDIDYGGGVIFPMSPFVP
jgi:hypothetical protein